METPSRPPGPSPLLSSIMAMPGMPGPSRNHSIVIHSGNRQSGTPQEGVISIPFSRGSNYPYVRLVTFACYSSTSSTPSTSDLNSARAGIFLTFDQPGFTQPINPVRSDSDSSGTFFIPLSGAIDNERVTFAHRRWLSMAMTPSTLQSYRIQWASNPGLVDSSWNIEWYAELEFSLEPYD